MPIIINSKFPRRAKKYNEAGDANTKLLLDRMSKIVLKEAEEAQAKEDEDKSIRGGNVYRPSAYEPLDNRKKRGKPKTFAL